MATYLHHQHVESPEGRTEAVQTTRRFSPGQIIGGLAGVFFTIVGIIVITRTGIDGSLNDPVTTILGTKQSAYVGLFELLFGLLLVAGSTSIDFRGAVGFVGGLILVAGVVIAAASDRIVLEVGASRSTGVFAIIVGAIALFAAMMPSFVRTEQRVDTY